SNIDNPSVGLILVSLASGFGLVAVSFLASRYVLPIAFRQVAQNPELMLVLSISWCFIMCWLALMANFSIAMGALIAGVSISTFPYSHDVIVKIRSLRDFFVTLFFVSLGMQLIVESATGIITGLILSLFIILSRIVTIFPTSYVMKLGSRVGVLSSLHLAQSSEFSLVIATLGLGYGHISQEIVSLIAITLVITSTLSTYMVIGSHAIARTAVRLLEGVGVKSSHHQEEADGGMEHGEILLLGCHRLGSALVHDLVETNENVQVLDFNPEVLTKLKELGVAATYADISHVDTLKEAEIRHAKFIICAVSDEYLRGTSNLDILQYLRSKKVRAHVIVQSSSAQGAVKLYEAGADYVLIPPAVSSAHILSIIEKARFGELESLKAVERKLLKKRKEVLS
ncbi:MAG: cation:proton antiporter, partial [Bacteroidota bacterium]